MEGFPFTPDQFTPDLIHRILLTDEEDLSNLSLTSSSGEHKQHNHVDRTAMTFSNFCENHGIQMSSTNSKNSNNSNSQTASINNTTNVADQIANTMRRAFFDQLYTQITQQNNFQPFQGMMMELFTAIRNLIPHRADLHSFLSEESIHSNKLRQDYLQHSTLLLQSLIPVGQALIHLEAPDQIEATQQWLNMAQHVLSNTNPNKKDDDDDPPKIDGAKVAILSTAYLIHKANDCQLDIQNIRVRHMLAPQLRVDHNKLGIDWEHYHFQKQHGSFDTYFHDDDNATHENEEENDKKSIPHTRAWIQQIFTSNADASNSNSNSNSSKHTQIQCILQTGIVQSIVFSSSTQPVSLPEVLHWDSKALSSIRTVANLSVTGSALALHACLAAGVVTLNNLGQTHALLSQSSIQNERSLLTHAMAKGKGEEGKEMTHDLEHAMVSLVHALKTTQTQPQQQQQPSKYFTLNETEKEALLHRGTTVLRGTDAVFQLLDKRIRSFFATMIVWKETNNNNNTIPNMQTGRASSASGSTTTINPVKQQFMKMALQQARLNGFSIYARDLANASWDLKRIGDHMIQMSWDVFLSRTVTQIICQQRQE